MRSVCHVLIIEDEPLVALDLQTLLEAEGATSFDFADSEAGAVAAAIARPPGLITSDVKLVEGTGPNAVTMIHQRLGDIPVIFITGTPEECRPCNPPGQILSKPLNGARLRQAFHDVMGA